MTKYNALTIAIDIMTTCAGPQDTDVEQAVEVISKMKETHMSTITISLDGMKKTHEEFRHVPGSFDRIISAIERIKKDDFVEHIQVTFIATKNNIFVLTFV